MNKQGKIKILDKEWKITLYNNKKEVQKNNQNKEGIQILESLDNVFGITIPSVNEIWIFKDDINLYKDESIGKTIYHEFGHAYFCSLPSHTTFEHDTNAFAVGSEVIFDYKVKLDKIIEKLIREEKTNAK